MAQPKKTPTVYKRRIPVNGSTKPKAKAPAPITNPIIAPGAPGFNWSWKGKPKKINQRKKLAKAA